MYLPNRRKRGRFFKLLIFLIIPLLLIFVGLFFTRNLVIKNLEVEGENLGCVDRERLKNESTISGKNFFFINFQGIENNLKQRFICLKKIDFDKRFPDKVILKPIKRVPQAILLSSKDSQATSSSVVERLIQKSASESMQLSNVGKPYLVDDEGVIYAEGDESMNLPKIYLVNKEVGIITKINQDNIKNTLKILESLKTLGISVERILTYEDNLIVQSFPKIIFNLKKDLDYQLASLQLIAQKAKIDSELIEFIDLRFDKPVVRYGRKNG